MVGWEDVILGVGGGHAKKKKISHRPTLGVCPTLDQSKWPEPGWWGGRGEGREISDSNRPYLGHIPRVLTSSQHNLPECHIKLQCNVCVRG